MPDQISFDDLIPQRPATPAPPVAAATPASAISFDDLVPAKRGDEAAAIGRGLINGVPIVGPYALAGVERAAAGIRSLQKGTAYEDELKQVQEFSKGTAEANPKSTFVGEMGGGALGVGAAMAAAPAAMGLQGGMGLRTLAGAASGAGIGGTDAAVRSDGDVGKTVTGALIGGVAGGAAPAVARGAERLVSAGADSLAQWYALRGLGISKPAATALTEAFAADGTIGGRGAANITAAGPQGMLADAGPGARNVLDVAMQRGGPGSVAAREAIEARAAGAENDLRAAMDATLGQPQGLATTATNLREGSAAARRAAYDGPGGAFDRHLIDYDSPDGQALRELIDRVPGGIWNRANNLMQVEGNATRQLVVQHNPDGTVSLATMPDVRQFDYVKRALDDVAQRGDGAGKLGGNTAEGRAYSGLANDIRDRLAAAVPEYRVALDTAADPIRKREAMEFGSTLLSPGTPRDVAQEYYASLARGEQPYLRQGVRSAIDEKLANVRRTITDPNVDARQAQTVLKDLSSDAAREKIGLISPPEAGNALPEALDRTARALDLRASAAGNSRTYARLATDEAVNRATEPGALQRVMMGEPVRGGQALLQLFTGTRPVDRMRVQNEVYGELLGALTGTGAFAGRRGPRAADLAAELQAAYDTRRAVNGIADRIPYAPVAQTGAMSLAPLFTETR